MTEVSRRTGDYPSLSATDIKLLALTYQLELEHVGSGHLKTEPAVAVRKRLSAPVPEENSCREVCLDQLCPSSRAPLLFQVDIRSVQRHPETPVHVAGFHLPSKVRLVLAVGAGCQMCAHADAPLSQKSAEAWTRPPRVQEDTQADDFSSFLFWREPLPRVDGELLSLLVSVLLGQYHRDTSSQSPPVLPHQDPVEEQTSRTQETPEPSTAEAASPEQQQFGSFLFWREPLPSIEDELLKMLVRLDRSTQRSHDP